MVKKTCNISQLQIEGLTVNLIQKKIRTLRLSVNPPHGEIKVSAPLFYNIEKIKHFILSRIDWIKKSQIKIRSQKYVPPKKILDGENHYFLGEKYLLKIFEKNGAPLVILKDGILELHIKKNINREKRKQALDQFYRGSMKKIIPKLIANWENKLDVKVAEFGIKKMKTRWGTCNSRARRIWLNLLLAKMPLRCLDYIILHEMVHLLERHHNKKFFAHMDNFMPSWKEQQDELKNNQAYN